MSKFRNLVENILQKHGYTLVESEQKVDWILSQSKMYNSLKNKMISDDLNFFTELRLNNDHSPKAFLKYLDKFTYISKYLLWVVKLYLNDKFHIDDLNIDAANELLERFTKDKNKLIEKDINKYKSFNDLKYALNNIGNIKGTRERIRDAKKQAEKVYEDKDVIIIVPKTEDAAILYGKGTKWCTSSISAENRFDLYNSDGNLYIIIFKNNPKEKYQYYGGNFNEFRNSEEEEIDFKKFVYDYPNVINFFKEIGEFPNYNDEELIQWFEINKN